MKSSLNLKNIPRFDRLTSEQMDEIHGGRINMCGVGECPGRLPPQPLVARGYSTPMMATCLTTVGLVGEMTVNPDTSSEGVGGAVQSHLEYGYRDQIQGGSTDARFNRSAPRKRSSAVLTLTKTWLLQVC